MSRFWSVPTISIVATTATVGTTTRPRAHARWRAHQNTTTDAPQKPAPMNAALIGLAIVHEKNWSVCSERMNSWVPAKKVRAVST